MTLNIPEWIKLKQNEFIWIAIQLDDFPVISTPVGVVN